MSQTITIPQHTLDHYNAHYNNQTYRAFSTALAAALGLDERVTQLETYDERHNQIMNLLIDASMELVGAEFFADRLQGTEVEARVEVVYPLLRGRRPVWPGAVFALASCRVPGGGQRSVEGRLLAGEPR